MPEGVRQALMDRASKTPRDGLQVHLYPNTYYGFAIRGARRNHTERDRWLLIGQAHEQGLPDVNAVAAVPACRRRSPNMQPRFQLHLQH